MSFLSLACFRIIQFSRYSRRLFSSSFGRKFSPTFLKILNESSKPNNIMIESTYKVRCLCFTTSPVLHRKEVIQPHLPIRLPCYDFTLITSFPFDCVLLAVRLQATGPPDSHGVTGGGYKARERIHRSMLICDY